jgi:inositol polyphosphate-4-phosphatase
VHAARGATNVEILLLAEELVRSLRGARITSCKSAKDRTAMSVTAEQATLVAHAHGLSAHDAQVLAARMRREGVRLHNARKNTGRSLYSFSRLQRQWLPARYAPPEGTYARGRT